MDMLHQDSRLVSCRQGQDNKAGHMRQKVSYLRIPLCHKKKENLCMYVCNSESLKYPLSIVMLELG